MPNVRVDTINELELEEERGVIRSVTRNALVEFGSNDLVGNRTNTSILRLALEELDSVGLTDGSHIGNPEDRSNRYHALYLTKRSPKLVADNQKVNVKLRYDHVMDGHNQLFSGASSTTSLSPELSTIYAKGRCSVVDKTTNFFYKNGDETDPIGRRPIQVAYTFPPWEKSLPTTGMNPLYPRTILQGGEISIPYPQANCGFQGLVVTERPYLVARQIIRHINTDVWNGEPPLTWLCSEVSWELNGFVQRLPLNLSVYKMGFEFQFNSDTWDPFVVFNDTRWGNPPANPSPWELKIANVEFQGVLSMADNPLTNEPQPAGAWKVPALPRCSFKDFFGATLDGMP